MQKIIPNLWFDTQAEEAANFYVSVFKNSEIGRISRYTEAGFEIHKMPAGTVLTVEFRIAGQDFLALNGGPIFKFNESISFVVYCTTQEEIDYYWEKLSAVPEAEQCGWLKDKYGVSWQIVPDFMSEMIQDKDTQKVSRVMEALLKMKKLEIAKLKEAYEG